MPDHHHFIYPVMCSFVVAKSRMRLAAKGCRDVGHKDIGMNLLLDGVEQFSAEVRQLEAEFERFKFLLNSQVGVARRTPSRDRSHG
jgi:hypothetical protein